MIVQPLERLSSTLGVELSAMRDDLLPFPLPGNKFRKVAAEAEASGWRRGDLVVTNGGLTSNHCRTVAMYAAQLGMHAHLVLHGDAKAAQEPLSLCILRALGASYSIVEPEQIASEVARVRRQHSDFRRTHVLSGGCHTVAGARAYQDVAREFGMLHDVDHVFVASGTGATQAGIIAGLAEARPSVRVTGVSVARSADRGLAAIEEALDWLECEAEVVFDDRYVDGGYGTCGASTQNAVALGWENGLPLDPTYTGKAFRALLGALASGEVVTGSRVLFWHTGGLMNHLESLGGAV